MESEQKRVILWTAPRCVSSAFFRAINNATSTKGIFEPFALACYRGSERTSSRYSDEPPIPGATYADIKAKLEGAYIGYKVVFAKDMAHALFAGPRPHWDLLPNGYKHTFLIRDPKISLPSYYKISTNKEEAGWDYFDPGTGGLKYLYQLFITVTEKLGQEAIILDADDLLSHPVDMLHQYCEQTGIEFQRVMIHWDEAPPEKMNAFNDWSLGWFRTAMASSTFEKVVSSSKFMDVSNEPLVVQQAIKDNQPYYEKLYNMRMLPSK